jgi:hypothetical protein
VLILSVARLTDVVELLSMNSEADLTLREDDGRLGQPSNFVAKKILALFFFKVRGAQRCWV